MHATTACGPRELTSWRARLSKSGQHSAQPVLSPPPTSVHVVCFVASHIRDVHRARMLARMLSSVAAQVEAMPCVAMSWSADAAIAHAVRESIAEARAAGLRLHSIEQNSRHSQFQHLGFLVRAYEQHPPAWIMFSDDDDLWSEYRLAIYERECALAAESTQALLCRRKAMVLGKRAALAMPPDANAVRALISSGDVRLTDADQRDGLDESEHHMPEYFDVAVRYDRAATFFATMPPLVIAHKLCDLAFCFIVTSTKGCVRFMPPGGDFVYFYQRGGQPGGASNELTPLAVEAEVARQAIELAPPPVRALFGSRPDGGASDSVNVVDRSPPLQAISFVAGLRQAIEQELIRLRVTGRVVPSELIWEACRHEAEVCVRSQEMDAPWMRAVDGLLEWTERLATGMVRDLVLRRFEFEALVDWNTWQVELIRSSRGAAEILRSECYYSDPRIGGAGPVVGMWFGGGKPPPAGTLLAPGLGPPSFFRVPKRREVY